jgi:hypothetical protein
MTEAEWLACTDPQKMLAFLLGKTSDRKLRLFAVACCRQITPLMLKTELGYRGVVLAEKLADGQPIAEKLTSFRERLGREDYNFGRIDVGGWPTKKDGVIYSAGGAAYHALDDEHALLEEPPDGPGRPSLMRVIHYAAMAAAHWQRKTDRAPLTPSEIDRELRAIVPLVHEVFGNPFRCAAVASEWLEGTGSRARAMAQVFYDERAFEGLPILADALEEAGCTDTAILDHFRGRAQHYRGCWALDLILGKS